MRPLYYARRAGGAPMRPWTNGQGDRVDHETAASLLSDFSRDALPPGQRREMEAHLAACPECQAVLSTLREVRTELSEGGSELFGPHPTAEALARFAAGDPDLDVATRDHLEAHARRCPTCAREVSLAREADRTAWARAPEAWIRQGARRGDVLRPALAVLAALLVFPAYLGLVRYPEERAEHHRLEREMGLMQRPAIPPPVAQWGGAAPLLMLSGPERGGSAVPTITLRPGQPYVAVMVSYDPRGARGDSIEVRIVRASDHTTVWRTRATGEDLWDPALEGLTLLAPAEGWLSGAYRLELASVGHDAPRFSAPFQLRRPTGS